VARGGSLTLTPHYWGSRVSHDNANYGLDQCWPCGIAKQGKDRWYYTSPVGSFAPNYFGLYDVFGNVWQWTNDCYHESFNGVPNDGAAWVDGDCQVRALRGGSYNDQADYLEIVARNFFPTHVRNNANGFRVARTLD
jgi:formylglycine-generating enzyme required for sulfatase activity